VERIGLERGAIAALFFLNGFAFSTWVSRIPAVQASLNLTPGSLGAALAGLGAGSLVAMPATGWLIGRIGSRPVLSATAIACALVLVLPGLATNVVLLGVFLATFGAAVGSMDIAMNAQAVELEHRYGRPIMATFHALWSLGGMSGAAIGGLIASRGVAVVPHFVTIAVVVLTVTVALLPLLVSTPPDVTEGRQPLRASAALVGLSLLATCILIAEGAMADWTPVYLESVLGTGPGMSAAGYAVFSGAMTAGRLTGDWLTVQLGRTRIVRVGALMAAAGLSVALVLENVAAALAGFACVGAGLAVIVPLVFSAAGRLDERSAGPGLAVVTTAGYFGFLAGPPLIGGVAELFSLTLGLAVVVILALVGAALAKYVALPR
jgi:MFS family permease